MTGLARVGWHLSVFLCLAASPVAAESLTCDVLQLCETDDACKDGGGMKVRLDLEKGDKTGAIVFEPGGEYQRAIPMRRVAEVPEGQSFIAEAPHANVFFLTLYTDGVLMMSVHESGSASAAKGKCPERHQ
jgi:hypothetical protein